MPKRTGFNRAAKAKADVSANDNTPKIFIPLWGGASFGAFTAGALVASERLGVLEHLSAVSGTSAGANNAVALVAGIEDKEPGGVKRILDAFWDGIGKNGDGIESVASRYRTNTNTRWPNTPPKWRDDIGTASQAGNAMKTLTEAFTKYSPMHALVMRQFESFYGSLKSQADYVRDHIADVIPDWDVIRNSKIKTFIGAARIADSENGLTVFKEKNFTGNEISAEAVGASGCLFGSVEIDGHQHKDGAFSPSNPPIESILDDVECTDIFVIALDPEPEFVVPKKQSELVAEGSDGLMYSETYAYLAYLTQHSDKNIHVLTLDLDRVRDNLLQKGHSVPDKIDETSKMTFDTEFVTALREVGDEMMVEWHNKHGHNLGIRSTYKPVIAQAPAAEIKLPDGVHAA